MHRSVPPLYYQNNEITYPMQKASSSADFKDTVKKIFYAATTIGIVSIGIKVIGFFREFMLAHIFGVSDVLDCFILAFTLPSFFINVVSGAVSNSAIPAFIDIRVQAGREAASRFLESISALAVVLLTVITAILALGGPYLIGLLNSDASESKLGLTTQLLFVLLPSIALGVMATFWSSIANASERFLMAILSQALVPVTSVIALAVATRFETDRTALIHVLSWSVVIGTAFQAAFTGWLVKRLNGTIGVKWHGYNDQINKVVRQFLPIASGSMLMTGTVLIDQSMSAMLEAGSVSALSYANKVTSSFLDLGIITLGTAVLPYYSKLVSEQKWSALKETNRFYQRLIFLMSIPLIGLFWLFGQDLIRLLFERGAFTSKDTQLVFFVAGCLLLQAPFHVAGILKVRMISALKANHFLIFGNILSLSLNVSLNYVLMQKMGVAGIALSTSIVFAASYCYLSTALHFKLKSSMEKSEKGGSASAFP